MGLLHMLPSWDTLLQWCSALSYDLTGMAFAADHLLERVQGVQLPFDGVTSAVSRFPAVCAVAQQTQQTPHATASSGS